MTHGSNTQTWEGNIIRNIWFQLWTRHDIITVSNDSNHTWPGGSFFKQDRLHRRLNVIKCVGFPGVLTSKVIILLIMCKNSSRFTVENKNNSLSSITGVNKSKLDWVGMCKCLINNKICIPRVYLHLILSPLFSVSITPVTRLAASHNFKIHPLY